MKTTFCFQYFVDYKLSEAYAKHDSMPYATYFLHYVTFAAQVPNVIFNWINVFLNVRYGNLCLSMYFCINNITLNSGNLTSRVVWTLFIEVVIFVVTIILAMIDTTTWPGIFFQITIFSIVVLNSKHTYCTT